MDTATRRLRLAVGFERTRTARIVTIVILACLGVPASGCLGFILGMLTTALALDSASDTDPARAGLPWVLAGLLAALFAAYAAVMLALVLRRGAWLDGTRLTVRVLRERTVDLATAQSVTLEETRYRLTGPLPAGVLVGPSGRVSRLMVTAPAGTVRMWLASRERVLLPSDQLLALANALSVSSAPGAAEVAGWLRTVAARPRGG